MKSADTIGGWRNHYHRMRRWEERSLCLLKDLPATDFHDAIDMSLAYFLWAHSLREWLVHDRAIAKEALDVELGKHPIWNLCRDVANRTRHFDLTHSPTDKNWSAYREYDPFGVLIEGRERHTANILFDGKKVPLSASISDTSRMWRDILHMFNLSY